MRKLKLQVQLSVDGFVAGPNHEMDWMTWNWDDKIKNYVTELHTDIDTILMGRKMTDGFMTHWENTMKDKNDPSYKFARLMVETPKVVFTRTLDKPNWQHTVLAKGNIVEEVNKLKSQPGKDIIVYGGAGLNASLIKEGLIDDLHLFINPAAIGKGLPIFKELNEVQKFNLKNATAFDCGIVVLNYSLA